jgi:ribosome-associated protein
MAGATIVTIARRLYGTGSVKEREYDENGRVIRPNKTALKRDLADRSELLDKMTQLSDAEMEKIGVDPDVIEEVAKVRSVKKGGARNRQLKYCVKVLTGVDLSVAETYIYDRNSHQLAINQAFHLLEKWRDRLVEEGDEAMGAAMDEWPQMDRQQLRHLVRDAKKEHESGKPAGAKKKLFQFLRTLSEQEA